MGTEKPRNVALENDDLGFIIGLKPLYNVGQPSLKIMAPDIDRRCWVVESDFEDTGVLRSL